MVTSRTGMKKARGKCICAAGQGMVFELSVLNRVYNFERVCSFGCTIELYDLFDKICVSCKYTK